MDGDIDVYKHFSWLKRENHHSAPSNETYQERLARLEGDKESLILQVSVLTDQVEAQGEKIRDLEVCLEGHQVKLNAAEEMLQQELLSRTSLETQKLDLMTEVSELKLKLVGMEKEQREQEEKQRKAESVLNVISELQEQMCRLQLDIHRQIQARLLHNRDHPEEEVVAGDCVAEPQPCRQDCAPGEGSPVGTTLKYIRACVWGPFHWWRAGLSPNRSRVMWFSMDLAFP